NLMHRVICLANRALGHRLGVLAFVAVFSVGTGALATDYLYVVQAGDGSAALTNAATPIIIKKLDASSGATSSSIPLPIAVSGANQPIAVSGVSTTEGMLNLSSDNRLTMAGYMVTPGFNGGANAGNSVAGTSSATDFPRGVAVIDISTPATPVINT